MILDIFHNFLLNKIIIFNDKDTPCVMMIFGNWWIELFKQFINNGKLQSKYDRLQCICSDLVESIISTKEKFHLQLSAKLCNPSNSSKTYWSILKTFANCKKFLLVPLLLVNEKFMISFLEKLIFFMISLGSQYQTIVFFC